LYNKIKSLNHKRVSQLINFIIEDPREDDSYNRSFRYPFYACEILSDEQTFIADIFFPSYAKSKDENEFSGFSRKTGKAAVDECEGQFLKVKLTMPEVIALDN
jgi:hypothetical protein